MSKNEVWHNGTEPWKGKKAVLVIGQNGKVILWNGTYDEHELSCYLGCYMGSSYDKPAVRCVKLWANLVDLLPDGWNLIKEKI